MAEPNGLCPSDLRILARWSARRLRALSEPEREAILVKMKKINEALHALVQSQLKDDDLQ